MTDRNSFLTALRGVVPGDGVVDRASDLAGYQRGWRYGQGVAFAAVRPRTPQQVAAVLALCHAHGVRVQTVGGNTGLVGATNPDATGEQLVLALERLNRTIEIDPIDRTVRVDGGVRLSQLNEALDPHGLCFPIDLGADPQIGGMVATNTGGTSLLKYGDVRHNLLGLEVALGDGTVVSQLAPLRKNNTGLDYKQLFVGTSGVFGVVTQATLQVAPKPRQRITALAAVGHGAAALALLRRLELDLGELLTAFEVISRSAFEITLRHGADVHNPFGDAIPAYTAVMLLTTTLPTARLDLEQALQDVLAAHVETPEAAGLEDVLIDPKGQIWRVRHQITESLRSEGRLLAFDLSVPRARLPEFSAAAHAALARNHPFVVACDYGHWGDGGTHLNLLWPDGAVDDEAALVAQLQQQIYDLCVRDFGGSFSAEHGVGPHNQAFYDAYTPAPVRAACDALKDHFDPARRLGTLRLGTR